MEAETQFHLGAKAHKNLKNFSCLFGTKRKAVEKGRLLHRGFS
jgi:hypothetical protein